MAYLRPFSSQTQYNFNGTQVVLLQELFTITKSSVGLFARQPMSVERSVNFFADQSMMTALWFHLSCTFSLLDALLICESAFFLITLSTDLVLFVNC